MSINLHLEATTKIKKRKVKEECNLLQTSTDVTYKILRSPDKLKSYFEWLDENHNNDHNFINDHKRYIKDFLKDREGWFVEWYCM